MSTIYKVWIQVEKINEDADLWENIGEPNELLETGSKRDALAFVDWIQEEAHKWNC